MKVFMAGLRCCLTKEASNDVTIDALAEIEHEAFHTRAPRRIVVFGFSSVSAFAFVPDDAGFRAFVAPRSVPVVGLNGFAVGK
jgi:hypothetical protein